MTSISDVFEDRFSKQHKVTTEVKGDHIDPKSLYLFSLDNNVRKFCRSLMKWKPFEWFIVGMIIMNSFMLSIIGIHIVI